LRDLLAQLLESDSSGSGIVLPASKETLEVMISRLDEIIAKTTDDANRELWDGKWYIRGYTRDGVKIGSNEADEGKIFLEHMPWAIISGIADKDRGESSMDSVYELLASPYGTHLCWPSYTKVDDTIGYVTRVYPGVKENGSIFSHPNAWPIIAETMLGHGDRAVELYNAMAPYLQNDTADVRHSEPYVYAQFIYGRDHEFYGRAENPWLTGTAGWMYTAATRFVLGVRPDWSGLVVDPCVPQEWDGFTVSRQWRGATYRIHVANPGHVSCGVASITVDGSPLEPAMGNRPYALLPVGKPGQVLDVAIELG
jgi:N,N'-diacetylchitobiose phosphorylase